jgi:hypothetical protein
MSLCEVLARAGSDAGELQVVCVERHPYAKIVSWVNHIVAFQSYRQGGEYRANWQALQTTLVDVIDRRAVQRVRNVDIYRDPSGGVNVHVLRVERLAESLSEFAGRLGTSSPQLPYLKRSWDARPQDLVELVSPARVRVVNELFAEEFERFGYDPL